MPSTYTNDLRIEEQATGENSGTWGTKVNSAFSQIAEAFSYGTQDCFSSDADATTTVADGATDPARAMYFKVTSSATLTATRTLTIAPNTISRVMFIENATTGSQSIAINQGSGANVTIGTGKTKVVYLDGAGATAAVVDAMAKVDPGVTDTLAEVLTEGNISSGTNIELTTTDKVQFRDSAIYLNSSADGQLDIVADTEVQIATATVDLNGALTVSGDANFDSGTLFVDVSTNQVGIGTTDPSADALGSADDLVIKNASSAGLTIKSADSGNQTIALGASSDEDYAIIQGFYNSGSPFVRTSISGLERTRVNASGFDVTGTVTADGLTVSNSSLQVKLEEADGTYNPRLVTYFDSSGTHLQHTWSSGATNLIFEAGGSEGSGTERMRIDGSTGNVKIGTGTDRFSYLTASTANLQIDGGLVFEPGSGNNVEILNYRTSAMIFGNSGTEDMRIDGSTGNVGIGASSPAKRVHIYDSTQANQAIRFGNPAATPYGEINYQSLGFEHLYITAKGTTTGYGNIVFSTGPTPTAAMQINADGSTSIKANAGGLTHVFGYNENGGEISLYDDGGSQATLIDQSNNSTRVLELINGSDLAIGLGAANTTGNVIFYGAGLDEAARFDASGDLLLGKSSTPLSVQGTTLFADGTAYHTVDGNAAMRINRLTSDGEIIDIRKDGTTVGSIGSNSSKLYIGTGSANIRFRDDLSAILPTDSDGSNSDADLDLGYSTVRWKDLYLSGGVYVGGTAAANKLDDYEEGTWTPNLVGDSTEGAYSSVTRLGTYTKVGRLVTATFYFYGTSGTGSGKLNVTGFPFAAQGAVGLSVLQYNSGPVLPSGTSVPVLLISSGNTTAEIRCNNDSGGGYVEMDYPTGANYVRASVTYETS